jgi:hypothetical protein
MQQFIVPLFMICVCLTLPLWSLTVWRISFFFAALWNTFWGLTIAVDPVAARKLIIGKKYQFKKAQDVGRSIGFVVLSFAPMYAYIGWTVPFAPRFSLQWLFAVCGVLGKMVVVVPWSLDIVKARGQASNILLSLVLGDFAFAIAFVVYLTKVALV